MIQLIEEANEICDKYLGTPIEDLMDYHSKNKEFVNYDKAKLLVGMCMDNRVTLDVPQKFSYILRTGGGNLKDVKFQISYTIAMKEIQHIAIIGHDSCGMASLADKKEVFVDNLINLGGLSRVEAERHFEEYAHHEIGDEVEFVLEEAKRLQEIYPKIVVAPMFYTVDDRRLFLIKETA